MTIKLPLAPEPPQPPSSVDRSVALKRETEARQIPSGARLVLPAGTRVTIGQTLGGHFTVTTEDGSLVRIEDKDADTLGEELAQTLPRPAQPEGEFEEEKVWEQLRTVYDPEIPINLVDLGLIYSCVAEPLPSGGHRVEIEMSMTAPGCGMGDVLADDVRRKVLAVPGVREVDVEVVWDPPWDQGRMSDAARLQLGWM